MSEKAGWRFDRIFTPATVVIVKGARCGLCYCRICGAAILLDEREKVNMPRLHAETMHPDKLDYAVRESSHE